jgi:hypothetical protein
MKRRNFLGVAAITLMPLPHLYASTDIKDEKPFVLGIKQRYIRHGEFDVIKEGISYVAREAGVSIEPLLQACTPHFRDKRSMVRLANKADKEGYVNFVLYFDRTDKTILKFIVGGKNPRGKWNLPD